MADGIGQLHFLGAGDRHRGRARRLFRPQRLQLRACRRVDAESLARSFWDSLREPDCALPFL